MFQALLWIAAIGLALATAASESNEPSWWVALAGHFRLQWALGALGLTVLALHRGALPVALLGLSMAVLNGWALRLPSVPAAPAKAPALRVVFSNVSVDNYDPRLPATLVRTYQPDILGFAEVDQRWGKILEGELTDHPYRLIEPRPSNFGLALFSRFPLEDVEVRDLAGNDYYPALMASVRLPGREGPGEPVHLMVAHPHPPLSGRTSRMRDRQIDFLTDLRRTRPGPFILLADLNATPWSSPFQVLVRDSGLVDSRLGHGNQPTWPAPFAGFGLPLDHVLVSPDWKVETRRTGPRVGSDHLPVFAALSWRPRDASRRVATRVSPEGAAR